MERVRIGSREVGDGAPCYVIGEAGSNHDGDLEQAHRLIDAGAQAGVDAVKFQVFRADRLYSKQAGLSDYLGDPRPIYEIIASLEMPYEWLPELAEHCERSGVDFMASAFDDESIEQVDRYVSAHKISSYEMSHTPLVRRVAATGKPAVVSTGTAELDEVAETVDEFQRAGGRGLVLMQCTAAYPAPIEALNVRAVATLRSAFNVPVGLSDHSRDPVVAPVAALALGAAAIEKHFTLDNELPGPDHRFALEPDELALMVSKLREAEQALGSGVKTVQPAEQELRRFARPGLFSAREIAAGEELSAENVVVLRRGNVAAALEPKDLDAVVGSRAARRIPADSPLSRDDYV